MKTFKAEYVLDKAKPLNKEIEYLARELRKKGQYPQGYKLDPRGTIIFSGNVSCMCNDKFDKVYCDGKDNCNSNT